MPLLRSTLVFWLAFSALTSLVASPFRKPELKVGASRYQQFKLELRQLLNSEISPLSFQWRLVGAPAWVKLNPQTHALEGTTPTALGRHHFQVQAIRSHQIASVAVVFSILRDAQWKKPRLDLG